MSLSVNCPPADSLATIPVSTCPESMGQIQKVLFQRIAKSDGTKNSIATPKLKASWTPLLAATDGTKVTISPYLNAPKTEPGAPRTYGSGNEAIGGVEIIIGRNPTAFTGVFNQQPQKTIVAMKGYEGEDGNIGVFLIDENGLIGCWADNIETPTKYMPIPVRGFFVGDKTLGGFDAPDSNSVQWKFLPNWSDHFVMIKPTDFDALTDLKTPVAP